MKKKHDCFPPISNMQVSCQNTGVIVLEFYFLVVLMFNVDFSNLVDWSGRHEDSCGSTGQGRLQRRKAPRRLPATARGKRSAWSGNQQPSLTQPIFFKKQKWTIVSNCPLLSTFSFIHLVSDKKGCFRKVCC